MKYYNGDNWVDDSYTKSKNYTDTAIEDAKTVVNVKDFGAVGDGIADDTLPIRNAINSVAGSSTVTVYFPPGDYWLPRGTNLTFTNVGNGQFSRYVFEVPSNVKISGYGATILHDGDYPWRKVIFYIAGSNVVFEGLTFKNIYDMAGGSRPTDIPIAGGTAYNLNAESISNIKIKDCNFYRSWHPTKFGMTVPEEDKTISGVSITGCSTYGEPTSDSSGGHNFVSQPPGKITDVIVDSSKVYDMSVSAAIGLYGVHKATVTGNICKVSNINGGGIQLENGADHVTITGNVLEDHFNHIWVDDSTNVTITGNTAINTDVNSSYKGIRITFQGHTYNFNQKVTNIVANNNLLTNCRIAAELFSTIYEPGSTPSLGDITISNNQIHLDGITSVYGIYIQPCDSILISSNTIIGATTRSIQVNTSASKPSQTTIIMGNFTKKKDTETSTGLELVGTYGPAPVVESNRFTNGITYTRYMYNVIGSTYFITGKDVPNSNLSAPRGSVYIRTDGVNENEIFYVKNGDGLIGWVAVNPA